MLRKAAHIVLALFLLTASAGITFSMHYCGGELVSASVNSEVKSCCNDMTGGCCENKTLRIEVKEDFTCPAEFTHLAPLDFIIALPSLPVPDSALFTAEEAVCRADNTSPPPRATQTRLSLFQTYLC